MHTHDFLVDQGHQRHVVEAVVESLPEGKFVPSLDFIEKAINSSNCLTLVIATKDYYLFWEAYFQGKKQTDDFATLLTSVDVITEEQITQISTENLILLFRLVLVCHLFKHVKQVTVLSVDVTKDLDRCFKLDEWLLVLENVCNLLE